jgi:Predicted ATPase with chaperone activity
LPLLNASLAPAQIERHCHLESSAVQAFQYAVQRLSLSSRASHSVLKVSRTIADLSGSETINEEQIVEALQLRRFGDADDIWPGD